MKKVLSAVMSVMVLVCFSSLVSGAPKKVSKKAAAVVSEDEEGSSGFQRFYVYLDDENKNNHYFPTGWMGDFGDIRVNTGWKENAHSGKSCIKISYSAKMTQNAGWTGMYWQQPMSNWGDKKGGFSLTGATKLTFWARGEKGGEKITEFKLGGITGEYPDTDTAAIGPIELSTQWQKYTIDLDGKDLSNIIGGFCWSASKDDNPRGMIFCLDDIIYE